VPWKGGQLIEVSSGGDADCVAMLNEAIPTV